MSLQIDIARESERMEVETLDLSAFGRQDLVNLILQRSEVLYDVPRSGQVIQAWNDGDMGPIEAEVDRLGTEIARRAAAVIFAEYRELRGELATLAPRSLADIGCGYAFFDLFALRDLGGDVTLIDLESNDTRHFGFAQEAAAYSSLQVARTLLERNGIAPERITTVNPGKIDMADVAPAELVVSFLSCGFHYPVDSYLDYLERGISAGGAAILDLRGRTFGEQSQKLGAFAALRELTSPPKAKRVLLSKGGRA